MNFISDDPSAELSRADDLSTRALALDPNNYLSHYARAFFLSYASAGRSDSKRPSGRSLSIRALSRRTSLSPGGKSVCRPCRQNRGICRDSATAESSRSPRLCVPEDEGPGALARALRPSIGSVPAGARGRSGAARWLRNVVRVAGDDRSRRRRPRNDAALSRASRREWRNQLLNTKPVSRMTIPSCATSVTVSIRACARPGCRKSDSRTIGNSRVRRLSWARRSAACVVRSTTPLRAFPADRPRGRFPAHSRRSAKVRCPPFRDVPVVDIGTAGNRLWRKLLRAADRPESTLSYPLRSAL